MSACIIFRLVCNHTIGCSDKHGAFGWRASEAIGTLYCKISTGDFSAFQASLTTTGYPPSAVGHSGFFDGWSVL